MTVLDKIKALFGRSKSVAKVAEKRPPEVIEEKTLQVAREKLDKTTEPQKVPKAARKKARKAGKRKRAG